MKNFIILISCSLILVGCGGPTISEDRVQTGKIVVIGDSIAAGFGVSLDERYTSRLQQQLLTAGFDNYEIINQGISGDTSSGGLKRFAAVLDENPEIVIIQLGGNDFLRGRPISEVQSDLTAMIQQAQSAKADVLLVGVIAPPTRGFGYISQAKKMYQALEEDLAVVLFPNVLKGILLDPEFMQPDKIHPKSSGHVVIAENLWELLVPMLRD